MSFQIINGYACLGVLYLIFSACSDDKVSPDDPVDGPVDVMLTISTGSESSSRTTYTETPGSGYENYIDPSSVRIYFFKGASGNSAATTYQGRFTPTAIAQSADNPQLYYVTGKLDTPPSVPFRIIVHANYQSDTSPSMGAGTQISGLTVWNGEFDCPQPFIPSESTPIPMFGIKSFGAFKFTKEKPNDFGVVDMTRAVAKIIVKSTDISLQDVALTRCYRYGLSAPYNMYTNTTFSSSDNINIPRERAAYGRVDALTNVKFTKVTSSSYRSCYVLYLPEYRNDYSLASIDKGWAPDSLSFMLRGVKRTIAFKDYQEDKVLNICRNFLYDFQVETATLFYIVTSMSERTAGNISFD
jgi:hypothetical protein